MKRDAELHADDDRTKREFVDTKNAADTLIFTTERFLKDAGSKLKPDETKDIQAKIDALKKIKDKGSVEELKRAMEDLSAAAQKIGTAMYQQQKADANPGASAGQASGKDNVVEGQYEEVKDSPTDDKK